MTRDSMKSQLDMHNIFNIDILTCFEVKIVSKKHILTLLTILDVIIWCIGEFKSSIKLLNFKNIDTYRLLQDARENTLLDSLESLDSWYWVPMMHCVTTGRPTDPSKIWPGSSDFRKFQSILVVREVHYVFTTYSLFYLYGWIIKRGNELSSWHSKPYQGNWQWVLFCSIARQSNKHNSTCVSSILVVQFS